MSIDQTLAGSQTFSTVYTLAQNAITKLNNIADGTSYTQFTAPTISQLNSAAGNYDTVKSELATAATANTATASLPAFASFPAVDETKFMDTEAFLLALADFTYVMQYSATDLTSVTVDFSSMPQAPDLSGYTTALWGEPFWSNVKTGVQTYIANILAAQNVDSVLSGLSSETTRAQNAMYTADLARRQQTLRDLYSAANARTGAKGFVKPNCVTTALMLDAQQSFQMQSFSIAKELIKYITDWARDNWRFTVQEGISAHNSDVEFNVRYADAVLNGYRTTVQGLIDQYKLRLEYAMGTVEIKVKEFQAQLDFAIRKYTAENEALTRAYSEKVKAALEGTSTKLQVQQAYYSILIELAKTQGVLLDTEDKVALAEWAQGVQKSVELSRLDVEAETNQAVAKLKAVSEAAQAAASLSQAVSSSIIGIQTIQSS